MVLAIGRRKKAGNVVFPWFILLFLCASAARTLWPQGAVVYDVLQHAAKLMLILTLFLIGSGLSKDAVLSVGIRPMVQGVLLWLIVSISGLVAVSLLV